MQFPRTLTVLENMSLQFSKSCYILMGNLKVFEILMNFTEDKYFPSS